MNDRFIEYGDSSNFPEEAFNMIFDVDGPVNSMTLGYLRPQRKIKQPQCEIGLLTVTVTL